MLWPYYGMFDQANQSGCLKAKKKMYTNTENSKTTKMKNFIYICLAVCVLWHVNL